MGTRGFRIIKFRGRYWIFYNHWDSYPNGLGKSLVGGIPTDPEEYQKWLQSQRDTFAKWDSLLRELLTIQPEDMCKLRSSERLSPVCHAAFDERLQEDAPPYYASGFNDLFIEWIYTIDLDQEVFSVDNGAHLHLNHIPRKDEWIEALFRDSEGNRFLLPQLVSAQSVATLSLDPPNLTSSTKYETLQTRLFKAKGLDYLSPSNLTVPRLRWMLFNYIQKSQQRNLSVTLLSWQAQDLPFRELAFFILCLAAGGDHLALVDQRRVKNPDPDALYAGIMTGNASQGGIELASSLGVGYHMDGLPMGSAPEETKYWFEGALICLVPRLDCPGTLEKAIADAVDYGRDNCTKESFNAVLISIEHLVLIKSLPDGSVDHTELLPLIPITSHLSLDARSRYGDQAVEAFYKAKFPENDAVVEEPDTKDVVEPSQPSDQQERKKGHDGDDSLDTKAKEQGRNGEFEKVEAMDDDDPHAEEDSAKSEGEEDTESDGDGSEDEMEQIQTTPVTTASIEKAFMALIQFFEATTLETLRPAQPNEARLPEEICEMILRNVADTKTYNSCLKVSRNFRLICQRKPLVMDDVIFLEPLPKDPASLITDDEEKGPQNPSPTSDFLAVEISSGQQMEILLHPGRDSDALTCLVVAGNEWNRKTYVTNSAVRFQGLCLPAPRADKADKRKRRRQDDKPSSYDYEGTLWEDVFRLSQINTESETAELGQFWVNATRKLQHPVRASNEEAWTFPPNTLCYFRTLDSSGKGDEDDPKYFHFLYLRVKRASKYCDNPWDDIIREAAGHLDSTDERKTKYHQCPEGEVRGADDPYVILAVGVEVRLFRWEQGFDESVDGGARRKKSPSSILRELNPGKTLNICQKADREEIEEFLDKAEQHKEMIKARESQKCGGEKRWYISEF